MFRPLNAPLCPKCGSNTRAFSESTHHKTAIQSATAQRQALRPLLENLQLPEEVLDPSILVKFPVEIS